MASLFEKWDKEIDTKGLAEDTDQAAKDGASRTFKEVDPGEYEVAVQQMELKASRNGDPMVQGGF